MGEPVVEVLTTKSLGGVRPGAALSEPIVVRNTGEVPVRGLVLEVGLERLEFEERNANCRYPGFYKATSRSAGSRISASRPGRP
ncbi:hypothetical protein ACGFY9_05765 [Streptomyces sp. NPDC048504]|uniref:hypothetical protein n=1 Tax=Streptomyces sp. NPDC048504 TaxID=3365559 RepID=UPI00371EB0AB